MVPPLGVPGLIIIISLSCCHGDLALQARVLGRVDDPHPAVAEFGADGVRAEGRAGVRDIGEPDYTRPRAFYGPERR